MVTFCGGVRAVGAWAVLAVGCALAAPGCAQRAVEAPPPAPREFRGAWVATVANIDWPSAPGLSVEQQRRELDDLLNDALRLRLNALIFQVRPAGDALYRSELEPWSEWLTGAQGRAPAGGDWDPLAHAVEGAHARGLELHAWFNPFRARHVRAKSPLSEGHFARRRGMAVKYGSQMWFDPGVAAVRRHTLDVILDVVRRYDIDGVHVDDYFYPYPEGGRDFPDDDSFGIYRRGGGELGRDAWRRRNVDTFVGDLHAALRRADPGIRFGISPFGILRPGVPAGIQAGIDQYRDLHADVARWLEEGWCDYLSPQLYWPRSDRPHAYGALLDHWATLCGAGTHLWPGNAAYKAVEGGKGWSRSELLGQIERTRDQPRASGNVFYSFKWLRDDAALRQALLDGPYGSRALAPVMRSVRTDVQPLNAPALRLSRYDDGGIAVRCQPTPGARFRAVQMRCGERWLLVDVLGGDSKGLRLGGDELRRLGVTAVAVANVDGWGRESDYATLNLR